ncbi:MAG: ISKra4 family transposase [Chloroflexi bacterium]|nr:ISKra4 family transposase [Chloroflexota bacterium]
MSAIDRLGREFGEHVMQVTRELLMGSPRSVSEMERRIREALLGLGRFLLNAWLALQEGPYPAQRIACRCGAEAEYLSKRDAVLLTMLGRVTYQRAYYLCPRCHHGCCPLDERLGLRPGEMSAELESLVGMTGALMTFAKGSDLFEQLTLTSISPQSMDTATQAMGAEMMRVEEEWLQASEDGLALRAQERAPKDGRRLYAALDATKVHTHEQQGAEDEGWRDLKVGAWFVTDAPPPQRPEAEWDIRAEQISYFCDFAEAKQFGKLLWATGIQRQALRASELVVLGDGAEWIWNLAHDNYPEATQIVDWFHAAERLGEVAKAAFQDPDAQRKWRDRARELLWEGKTSQVIQSCQLLVEGSRGQEEARQAVTYFTNNASRMDYATYRSKGYQIGSGTIESGCKQLGIQRMKVPGATWNLEGARLTAKARAAFLSNQWEILATRREYLPRVA